MVPFGGPVGPILSASETHGAPKGHCESQDAHSGQENGHLGPGSFRTSERAWSVSHVLADSGAFLGAQGAPKGPKMPILGKKKATLDPALSGPLKEPDQRFMF